MNTLKVVSLYEDVRRIGRNDGAPLYLTHILRQMGHDVTHLIPDPKLLDGFGPFDLSIWPDWGYDALKDILDYQAVYSVPAASKVCWLSDTHLGYEHRLEVARHFQGPASHVFCMQKQACEDMRRDGIVNPAPVWLPHAFEPLAYPKKSIVKKYDVCFVGHINSMNRLEFLDRMFKEFPNFWFGQRLFEEAAEKYCQSRIVLNPPIKTDLNMRCFETLGTGSFLLTQDIPTIHELFEDGKHLVLYKDADDAVEKARYYLEHDEERNKIAQAGYEEAIAKHTYKHRVEEILKTVKENELCLRP